MSFDQYLRSDLLKVLSCRSGCGSCGWFWKLVVDCGQGPDEVIARRPSESRLLGVIAQVSYLINFEKLEM